MSKQIRAFTTLELLIVLVIIGFFVAMLAPKLEDMFDDATIKISDTNKKRGTRFERMWQVENPYEIGNNLVDIVYYVGDESAADIGSGGNYLMPSLAEDNKPQDGAEWLPYSFVQRLKPYRHVLNADEVNELNDMGLTHIYPLDVPSGTAINRRLEIQPGMVMLMVGARRSGGDVWACDAAASWNGTYGTTVDFGTGGQLQDDPAGNVDDVPDYDGPADDEVGIAYPDLMYRILLTVGEESSLVEDGVIMDEGKSPDAMAQAEHYRLDTYVIVLPRLRATVRSIIDEAGTVTPKLFEGQRDIDGDVEVKQWLVADKLDRSVQSFAAYEILSPEGYKMLDSNIDELWETTGGTVYDPAFTPTF